jgi:nitrate reductase gamma subunit
MSEGRYLKDRLSLYVPFSVGIAIIAAIILLLPYETVYVRDRTFLQMFLVTVVLCVAVFFVGVLYNLLLWMRGRGLTGAPEGRFLTLSAKAIRIVFSARILKMATVLYWEAIHLPKLKDRSVTRWMTHFLIMGGFILMFVLDLVVTASLDFAKYGPMISETGWAKLWIRDFAFDLTGLMILIGLCIASVRRFILRPKIVRTEASDVLSVLFLLAVVAGGFVLEAIGIAGNIPGHTVDHQYSFVGNALSAVMPSSWGSYYDQAWLVHGLLSALFIAYIPFSKLFHMFATPISIEAEHVLSKGVAA